MTATGTEIPKHILTPASYDIYAPVIFNKILSIIPKTAIANKMLENVFLNMYVDKSISASQFRSPLIAMLDHADIKSKRALKALNLFRECCAGASICIATNEKTEKLSL